MSRRACSTNRWWPLTLAAVAACGAPPDQAAQRTSALTFSASGTLMPFGGKADMNGESHCIAVVGSSLQVASCTATGVTFVINGPTIQTTSNPPLCVDIQFGDLTAGIVGVVGCNGTINQQWFVSGGQIVSANRSGGQDYCLDVQNGVHAVGTPLGLAPCNGTAAQAFWPAGYTMKIASTFSVTSGSPQVTQPECLDVLYDNESVGASLDDSVCNGSNAQWFILDGNQHIALANNPGLCLATGTLSGELAPVSLQTCSPDEAKQKWIFVNKGLIENRRVVSIANAASACLDILYGSPASPTTVDSFTCNGTAAQRWQPSPSAASPYVAACGGSTQIACPENNQFCELASSACATTPNPSGLCRTKPVTCSPDIAPVCACDGISYASDCERQAAGSSQWYTGVCSSSSCPDPAPTPSTSCSEGNISCVYYATPGGPCVKRLQCTNGFWSAAVVVCPS